MSCASRAGVERRVEVARAGERDRLVRAPSARSGCQMLQRAASARHERDDGERDPAARHARARRGSGRRCGLGAGPRPATKPAATSAITVGPGTNQVQSSADWMPYAIAARKSAVDRDPVGGPGRRAMWSTRSGGRSGTAVRSASAASPRPRAAPRPATRSQRERHEQADQRRGRPSSAARSRARAARPRLVAEAQARRARTRRRPRPRPGPPRTRRSPARQ